MSAPALSVEVSDRSGWAGLDVARWGSVAEETLHGEGVSRGHLDLLFVTTAEMADMNERFMGHDGPTDVLSFPLDTPPADGLGDAPDAKPEDGEMPLHLGDVVICPEVAQAQAVDHCGHFEAELTLLVVHGVLHILGHDHAEEGDRAVMVSREVAHLTRYGLDHPEPVIS